MQFLPILILSALALPLVAAEAPPVPALPAAEPGAAFTLPDVTVAGARSKPKDSEVVWEGFESGVTHWGSGEEGGRLKAVLSRAVASEGERAFGGPVEITDLKGDAKAGFFLQPGGADFSGIHSFGFDLYNGSKVNWEAKLIFQTGDEWQWNESPAFAIQPGWNKGLWLDLKEGEFSGKKGGLVKPQKLMKLAILLRPKEPVRGALYLDNLRVTGPAAASMAPKRLAGLKEYLVNDFEHSDGGLKPAYGSASRTELDEEHASQGRRGLKLVAVAQDPEQNAQFGIDKDVDLSAVQAVLVDVYNPGPPGMFAVTLSHGEWKYVEGPSTRLHTGWNQDVTFDLQGRNFKSEDTKWQANGSIPNFKVKRLGFSWNAGDTGRLSLTLDRLRFIAADDSAAQAYSPPPPLTGYGSELYAAGGAPPFVPRSDWSGARSASFSESFSLPGEGPALRLAYDIAPSGYAADFEWSLPLDLRGVRAYVIDAYNPNASAVDLAYVAQTGASQVWHQSQPVRLAPGWNHGLMLSVEGPVFQVGGNLVSLPGRGPDMLKKAFWHVIPVAKGPGSIHLAKVRTLRASVVPGGDLPVAAEASLKAGVDFEPISYELWDSGAGEGTFEKGFSGWQAQGGSGFNAAAINLGPEGSSQGKQALKTDFRGSGNEKIGIRYDPAATGGPAFPDLSKATRMRFDVYNPGLPLSVGVAFTVDVSRWIESTPVILRSGWNRDVTLELDSWSWQAGLANSNPGATVFRGPFPAELRTPGRLANIVIFFNKARQGTVWVDNIRWGYPGSSTRHFSDAEIGLRGNLGPLEAKVGLKAGHSADGSAWVLPGGSHLSVRGLGQSVTLSFGEGLAPMDDVIGLFTGRRDFSEGLNGYSASGIDQVSALNYEGSVAGLGLRAFGALPWGPAPFSWSGHAFSGLRAKALGPKGSYLGATWLHQRLGYEPGADVLSSPVEQSSQVLGLDGQVSLPGGLNLKAGYARTQWALEKETLLMRDSQGLPVLYSKGMDPRRDAYRVAGSWTLGPVDLSSAYQDVGFGFDNTLSDLLNQASKLEAKVLLHLDSLPGIKEKSQGPGLGANLLKGSSVSAELFTYYKVDDPAYIATFPVTDGPFTGDTYQFRLESGRDGRFSGLVVYAFKDERKAAVGQPLQAQGTNSDLRSTLRAALWNGASLSLLQNAVFYDQLQGLDSSRNAYGMDLAQRLWRIHTLKAGVAVFQDPAMPDGGTNTYYAGWQARWLDALSSDLSFGRQSFDENINTLWWNQDPTIRLRLEGSF